MAIEMIYGHEITRMVAQARIAELIAQAEADGRVKRRTWRWANRLNRAIRTARARTADANEPIATAAPRPAL
jgi:hypothetical protein